MRRTGTFRDHRTPWPNRLSPARAGDLAHLRFCTPALSERRSENHRILVERARFHLRDATPITVPTTEGDVQAYVFDPGQAKASVLVAHGWTSEASFMAVFAVQLARAGLRAVIFDQPAHGKNPRVRASLFDCSRALLGVAEALGPFRFAVAHSMGGLAALLAGEGGPPLRQAYPFDRFVLISSPNRFSKVALEYGETLGLEPAAQRHYERQFERTAGRRMADFTAARLLRATGRPALVIHARDDHEVLFENALEIVGDCPQAELAPFDGLGHRNVLHAPPIIRAILQYLSRS